MHGILLIDKPEGLSSHDVVRKIRRICGTRKVGHAGTLDPMATGVLVVAVGDGTKILQFLFDDSKAYRAGLTLGMTTDTYDSQGQVTARHDVPPINLDSFDSLLNGFRGSVSQRPPMFSALKRNGVPLYKLARQGVEVEREERSITIERLEIIDFVPPNISIEVECSKGTYIRSLIFDIGEAVGCGACMTQLRRLRSGMFGIEHCLTLVDFERMADPGTALISMSESLNHFPLVDLDEAAFRQLHFGIPPRIDQCVMSVPLSQGRKVRLCVAGKLVAVADFRPDRIKEKRGDFELIRVFIEPQNSD